MKAMSKKNRRSNLEEIALPEHATLDAKFFLGLADATRVTILELLLTGERNVGEIVATIGGSQSRISNHLACLRWCGFVTTRREGLYIYYQVTDPRVRELLRLGQSLAREHEEALRTCLRLQPLEVDDRERLASAELEASDAVALVSGTE